MISLLLFLLGSPANAAPFEIYLFNEKPGMGAPFQLQAGRALRLHAVRGGFLTIGLRFSEGAGAPTLLPLEELSLRKTKFAKGKATLNGYAIGVQAIEKSSFRNGPSPHPEVADILIPNEWLSLPGFRIPEKRIPRRPQYLIEIPVPVSASPGDFQARLHFRRAGQEHELPLQIRVHHLKLPPRLGLKTSFGFAPYGALLKHFGKWADKESEIHDAYARLALDHRVDLHKFYIKFAPAGAPAAGVDPLKTGDKVSFLRLWNRLRSPGLSPYGFLSSTTDLPVPDEERKKPTEAFWKAMERSVLQNDLVDSSFVYYVDEPEQKSFPEIRERLPKIRKMAPRLQFLGTTAYRKELEGTFNLWCPNLIHLEKPGFARASEYQERREKHGEHFWLYSSCSAHGCGPAYDDNTADLVTDRAAAYHRAFAWSAFHMRAEGILYYNTVESYAAGEMAPWRDPFLFHGYGEGNLFYPCTQRFCGIDGIRVAPSLRWKAIRDGLEDVEILAAGERATLPVREWAKSAFRGLRDFSRTTDEFEKVRVRVLEALDALEKK